MNTGSLRVVDAPQATGMARGRWLHEARKPPLYGEETLPRYAEEPKGIAILYATHDLVTAGRLCPSLIFNASIDPVKAHKRLT